MTDKEQIKAIIKQYADKGKKMYSETIDSRGSRYNAGFWDGYECCAKGLLRELEDMQEEPITSVWHDAKEEPQKDRQILLVMKNGNKKIFTHYGCSEYCIDCGWVKLSEQNKWAYIDDLLKL